VSAREIGEPTPAVRERIGTGEIARPYVAHDIDGQSRHERIDIGTQLANGPGIESGGGANLLTRSTRAIEDLAHQIDGRRKQRGHRAPGMFHDY
jgi:hypothetical protein